METDPQWAVFPLYQYSPFLHDLKNYLGYLLKINISKHLPEGYDSMNLAGEPKMLFYQASWGIFNLRQI